MFLGILFDESLCFSSHFVNLRSRALRRLNILKIFSHKSWKLGYVSLKNIYGSLIGSIFDYSFFTYSCVSQTSLNSVQRIQNRAIRAIYSLPWDSPTNELYGLSGIISIGERFLQLGVRFAHRNWLINPLISELICEYIASRSSINRSNFLITPSMLFITCLSIIFCCNGLYPFGNSNMLGR